MRTPGVRLPLTEPRIRPLIEFYRSRRRLKSLLSIAVRRVVASWVTCERRASYSYPTTSASWAQTRDIRCWRSSKWNSSEVSPILETTGGQSPRQVSAKECKATYEPLGLRTVNPTLTLETGGVTSPAVVGGLTWILVSRTEGSPRRGVVGTARSIVGAASPFDESWVAFATSENHGSQMGRRVTPRAVPRLRANAPVRAVLGSDGPSRHTGSAVGRSSCPRAERSARGG